MAKFLNTSATTYYLEELIKGARERLILISPFLKLNDRIRELLEDKNRMKIDVRIVYGKSELHPDEINWLKGLNFVRTSYCKNLHAKCYMNEESCIITSLNLYEFSQVNNNEMGIYLSREDDAATYRDAYEEAQRLVRVSDEVRIGVEKVSSGETQAPQAPQPSASVESVAEESQDSASNGYLKLTTARLATGLGLTTAETFEKLVAGGLLELKGQHHYLTEKGKSAGGSFRKGSGGFYFLWPSSLTL
ncbi:phospholipase D-like domain-containing protein [Geopseudomonas aromaticivorans]